MSKKNIIFLAIIIALTVYGRFFYFWIIMPALLGIVVFYSIQFYKSKLYFVYPAIIFGTLLFCFSAGEWYFWKPAQVGNSASASLEHTDADQYKSNWYADPVLGYGAKQMESQTSSRRTRGDEVVFDVMYTTDEKGRRITPDNNATADTLILLFGCSFTFGEGLNDKETFAWQLGELLGPKFQVYNYGFHGYGSHQMLALLESDRLDELKKKYKNTYAYYLSFPSVEQRSAGIAIWWGGSNTPRYVLDGNGAVKSAGTFNYKLEFRGKLGQSELLDKIASIYNSRESSIMPTGEYMLDLHAGIIKRSAQIFAEKFIDESGHGIFTAVVYPNYEGLTKRLDGMELIDLTDSFGEYTNEKYEVSPYDGHPSYEATKIIAQAYYEKIMEQIKEANAQ